METTSISIVQDLDLLRKLFMHLCENNGYSRFTHNRLLW